MMETLFGIDAFQLCRAFILIPPAFFVALFSTTYLEEIKQGMTLASKI